MEIRVLRYFLKIAQEENITKAAGLLHISQPTLSRQIKELEDELGKKLFIRSNYSIKLTEEGVLLRKRAEDILEMVDKTTAEFKCLDEISGGDIHIGCAESQGIHHFVHCAFKLRKKYPNIRFHFYSSGTDGVSERLSKGLIDFAIIVQEVDLAKYNYLKIPFKDSWGLIMRKDSPLSKKTVIQLEDLLNIPLITSRQSLTEDLPKWFGDAQAKLNIIATYDLIFNATILTKEGLGYTLGFDKLISTGENSELCFRPLKPVLETPMYIIWKKYQVFTPVADLLLGELQREFLE